jgi:hypothetical protein
MTFKVFLMGALLLAAPVFSQIPAVEQEWITKLETREDVTRMLGKPAMAADFGADFRSWQYQLGNTDHDDFSHSAVFRRSSGQLVSVTRNYEPELMVDELFPASSTTTHYFPSAEAPKFSVRVRRLPGDRLLIAIGVSKPGQKTGQVVWIRASELQTFYPWIRDEIGNGLKVP